MKSPDRSDSGDSLSSSQASSPRQPEPSTSPSHAAHSRRQLGLTKMASAPNLQARAYDPSTSSPTQFPVPAVPHIPQLRHVQSRPQLGVAKLPVSVAFKRTCYKCGNLGHHADECGFKERLCYNCKQPGHESSKCPNARNTQSKQCYFCKGVGHIQSECPKYKALKRDQNHFNPPQTTRMIPSQGPQPPSAQFIYYSQLRNQLPPPPPPPPPPDMYQRQAHFYYSGPPAPHQALRQYPPPPGAQQYPLPQSPQQISYYPQAIMRQTDYFYPQHQQHQPHQPQHLAAQHYGPQLVSMRGYPGMRSGLMCYTCGEPGHESKACPRR